MVSTFNYIPIFETEITVETNERSKESLTSQIKQAVNKVHNVSTAGSSFDPLQSNVAEVLFLCESLDRAFLHGLKQLSFGYWPFVKEFTHPGCKFYLEGLTNVTTSLGLGRAWLCQALNESSLESYISSFVGNPKILEKHYSQPALLRDTQRMQLILTLMAGLEYVGFDMPVDLSTWDTLGFANIVVKPEPECDIDNLSASSSGLGSKSTCASATPVSMRSLADEEYTEKMSIESAFEATDERALLDDCLPDCCCKACNFKASLIEEHQRVSRLIELDPDRILAEDSSNSTLTVTRAKITKPRRKKGRSETSSDSADNNNLDLCENSVARSDESEISSHKSETSCDLDCPGSVVHRDSESSAVTDVVNLPKNNSDNGLDLGWLGERGVPEGQEDPKSKTSSHVSQEFNSDSQTVNSEENICSVENCDKEKKPVHEDEPSIYDLGSATSVENVINKNLTLRQTLSLHHWKSELSITSSATSQDEENYGDGDTLKEEDTMHDRSLRVDNNVLLYLSLEIFQNEDEELYKVFLASSKFCQGGPDMSYVVITNCTLYVLLVGNEKVGRFRAKSIIPFEIIDTIIVSLNYQSFILQCHGGILKCCIYTGSDFLTRSILSNLEVSIRRKGFKDLPSVLTSPSHHIQSLSEQIAKELAVKLQDVELSYFALVQWENFMGLSPATTPAGPMQEGFLMYKHKLSGALSWTPGYFQLKGGVLFRFKDPDAQTPDFYFQLQYPHFNGCRRCQSISRPHAFELKLRGKEKIVLAAANDTDASNWLQAILQCVAVFGHLNDVGCKKRLQPCSIVIANKVFLMLGDKQSTLTVLGKAPLQDLISARTDIDCPTNCVLEFESGEANSCSGDWILLFADIDEKEKFLAYITDTWQTLFQVPLNVSPLQDLSLWNRCREHYQNQTALADKMVALFRNES